MNEQKHFAYEGNIAVNSKPEQVQILSVDFMTPARIKVNIDGVDRSLMVSVDIINRKVYDDKGEVSYGDKLFEYLDGVHSLPEDFFSAPEEIHQKAWDANADRERINEEMTGVDDGRTN